MLFLVFLVICLTSCDPDRITEGVTVEPLKFEIKHLPATTNISINDTMHFYAAIPNNHKLKNGQVNIKTSFGYDSIIPISTAGNTQPSLNTIDHIIISNTVFLNVNSVNKNRILGFYTYPQEDSIRFDFSIVFYRKGIYGILLSPSFYEGDDGKARVEASFKSDNLGWDLYQNGYPVPQLGEELYHNKLTIAVTD